jgi:hypothetical protein
MTFFNNLFLEIKKFFLRFVFQKKYYRTGKCKGCGRCCQKIYITHANDLIKTEEEFEYLKSMHYFYGWLTVVDKDETGLIFECTKLNKETGKFEADFRKRNWVDFKELRELLKPFIDNSIIYTIERIQQRPNEGETTSFMNGNSLGIFQGLYSYLQPIEYFEPSAGEWKKELGVSSLKDTSIQLAEEIYKIKLRDYLPKGKVDDIAEALLLAFYGFKKYYENNERK